MTSLESILVAAGIVVFCLLFIGSCVGIILILDRMRTVMDNQREIKDYLKDLNSMVEIEKTPDAIEFMSGDGRHTAQSLPDLIDLMKNDPFYQGKLTEEDFERMKKWFEEQLEENDEDEDNEE